MARIIPSFMDDHTPPGERDVFTMLSGGPEDWVALHSLDLAPWNHSLRTEMDFMLVIPDTGILCIEVKSHDNITFVDDRWYPPEIKRSPFKQALDARHTFYRRLRELAPQFRHVPVAHCCIFPRAVFDLPLNMSVQPAELLDARAFRRFRSASDFCADLKSRLQQLIESDGNLREIQGRLSATQLDAIIRSCLPVQKRRPDARDEILRREQDLNRLLREQQKPVLQLVTTNDRLIVTGAAGTGKTLIAMEVARRAADRGKRVGLLCFNQLVGTWIGGNIAATHGANPNLIVGRAFRVIAEMSGISVRTDATSDYWENDFPNQVLERLTDPEFAASAAFDLLVLDEAQDLLSRPRLWECLTGLIKGGTTTGSFCLFGDFDNQVLGAREALNAALATLRAATHPAMYRLTENCRNYRIVGESAVRLSGLQGPVYDGYLRAGGSIANYDIFFYHSVHEQRQKVLEWLREFAGQGYHPAEITILSFRSAEQSVAASLAAHGTKLRPAWQSQGDVTTYASVHAFKGMENKIIILTDVVLGEAEFHRDLFYTGMTRACETLRIACDAASRETLAKWLSERHDT